MAAWAASVMADNIKIDTKIICQGEFLSISRRFPEVVNVFMMTMAVVGGLQARISSMATGKFSYKQYKHLFWSVAIIRMKNLFGRNTPLVEHYLQTTTTQLLTL